jgi:hypothetical protein
MTQEEIRKLAEELKQAIDPQWLTEKQVRQRLQVSNHWVIENRSRLGARLVPGNKKGWRYRKDIVDAVLINPW